MRINVSPLGVWLKMGTPAMITALVLTALPPRVALAQPAPSALPAPPPLSSEATAPAPAPAVTRVPLDKLLGRQVIVKSGSEGVTGKLVEVSDTSAVIEKDGGERITLARDQITAARGRFSQPSPTASTPSASSDGKMSATDDTGSDDESPSDSRRRTFGFGTAFGGGFAAATVSSSSRAASQGGPALLLPTLELQFFLSRGYSIDVTMPIANMALVSKVLDGFYFNVDTFFNLNVGTGSTRFVVGPGVGFALLAGGGGAAGSFRLPAEVGLEVLNKKRSFGFKLLARPWVEFASGSAASSTGAGVIGAIAFSQYFTTMAD